MPERGRQCGLGRSRTLNGTTSGNTAAATITAQAAAAINPILSQVASSSQVAVQHGAYHYNYSSMTFTPQFPPVSPDNYNLTQATVTPGVSSFFSRIFGLTSLNVQATATAAYRPRDVAIVLDFSGSMNNETDLWNCESYLGSMLNTPNNTDPVFPQWGVYNPGFSPTATIQCTSSDSRVGNCNITIPIGGIPALVNDFLFEQPRRLGGFGLHGVQRNQHQPGRRQLFDHEQEHVHDSRSKHRRNQRQHEPDNTANKNFVSQGYKYLHRQDLQRLHRGSELLGQDVLHLAAGPDQRLAEEFLLHARRRDACQRQHGALGFQRQLAARRPATTSSITRPS